MGLLYSIDTSILNFFSTSILNFFYQIEMGISKRKKNKKHLDIYLCPRCQTRVLIGIRVLKPEVGLGQIFASFFAVVTLWCLRCLAFNLWIQLLFTLPNPTCFYLSVLAVIYFSRGSKCGWGIDSHLFFSGIKMWGIDSSDGQTVFVSWQRSVIWKQRGFRIPLIPLRIDGEMRTKCLFFENI